MYAEDRQSQLQEAGVLCDDTDVVLTHEMLTKMSDEEIAKVLPKFKVVSRAKPLDKKRLVTIAESLVSCRYDR